MRTASPSISISAILVFTTLSVAACAAPTDADEGGTATSESAFTLQPFRPFRPSKLLWPPAPLPTYTTIQGYAGAPAQQGHADGSRVTTFVRPELVASSSGGATFVIDKDPLFTEARLRVVFDTLGSVNPHVQTIARGYYLNGAAALAMDPIAFDAYYTVPSINEVIKVTHNAGSDRFAGGLYGSDFGESNMGAEDGDRLNGARFNAPEGLVRDVGGTLFVADTGNKSIRIISPAGVVSTLPLVGAPADFAPHALGRDARNGVLYTNYRNGIYAISTTGQVSLVAGHEFLSGLVDGAPMNARFQTPLGLTVDNSGNVFVADTNNSAIRKLVVNWGTTVTSVETVTNLAPSQVNLFGSGGYGPNDTTIVAPRSVAMWDDSLVFTDVGRFTLRRLQ